MTGEMRTLLEQAASGDRDAEARLIEDNSGLIWSIVRRYYGRGAEPDDLYQLACVGFIKAVRGFDVSLGNEFSTYAVPKIAGEIRRFLRDDGAVKVSRAVKERAFVCAACKATGRAGTDGHRPYQNWHSRRIDGRGNSGLRAGGRVGGLVRAGAVRRRTRR